MSVGNFINATTNEAKSAVKAEIEVKFFVSKESFENCLKQLGAAIKTPRRLMRRQLFAFPPTLRKENLEQQARVRDEGNCITMTLKESAVPRTMSSVQELEIKIDNFDAAVQIFSMSGYVPTTYQENYRTSWAFENCSIEIDEWPGLSVYAEIEAPSEEELKRVAQLLEIEETSFMCCSVFDLYATALGVDAKRISSVQSLTFENFQEVFKTLK